MTVVRWPIDGVRSARDRRATRRLIRRDPTFDFGATTSVRELAQADQYRRYFQQVDRDRLSKIVERQIFDSFVSFLREKGVDTSDFEEREAAILNYGVLVSGGSLQATNVAAGQGATATETTATGAAARVRRAAAAGRAATKAAK